MGKATENLRTEHEAILFVLKMLDKMIETKAVENETTCKYCSELVYFFEIFVDKCHHGKEENILLEELESE